MPSVRRLAAILAADVAGYSRLMGEDEEGTHERLKAHLGELVYPKIEEHRGRVVKNTGDGFLAEFPSVVDAVRCAVEIQRGMADREPEVAEGRRIRFRIGVNLGDVIAEEHDIFGDGVNVAARLEALAEAGGICVSRVVRDQVRDKVDLGFEDLGEQEIKNIARPVRLFRVRDRVVPVQQPSPASSRPLPLPDKPSIAVLPFQNMTGDPQQDYFVDGIVEEITTVISRLPWLFVIARNSSFTYKGRAVDVKQVARELGVRYVLEGSVRKAASRVRITGQLIDTATGAHIWADRFDGPLDDIFDLQEQVANNVVGAIAPKLRQSEIERATRKPTERLDVYDLYLLAVAELRKFTDKGCESAVALLGRALTLDPAYAPAAAMTGWCRVHQLVQGWKQLSDGDVAEGVGLAKQAVQSGRHDPDALWMAGYTLSVLDGDHVAAASAVNRALTLNPSSADAWSAKGWIACFRNQPGEGIEALHRAMRLSPLDPYEYRFCAGLALAHLVARRYEVAVEWVDRSLLEQPRYSVAIRIKVVLCAYLGQIDEAGVWLRRLFGVQPGLTIAAYKKAVEKYFPPDTQAVYVEGFRMAGMPEE